MSCGLGNTKVPIEWREHANKPGVYVREPQGMEKYFTTVRKGDLPNAISISALVTTSLPNLDERLRIAWTKLRLSCPLIAMTVEYEGKVYFAYDTNDLAQWLEETFYKHKDIYSDELYYQLKDVDRAQFHWLQRDGKQEFYIKIPHDFIDGIGLIQLMDAFLDNLNEETEGRFLDRGNDVSKLPPSVGVATGAIQGYRQEVEGEFHKLEEYSPDNACVVPMEEFITASISTEGRRIHRKITKESTDAIIIACKKLDITVSHAFHAAMVLAMPKTSPRSATMTNYSSFLPINLRNKLVSGYRLVDTPVVGVSILSMLLFTTFPLAVEYKPHQFLAVAKDFKKAYDELRNDPRLLHLAEPYGDMFQTLLETQPLPNISPFLSNMGVVDQHLKLTYGHQLTLEDFTIRMNIMGGCQLLIWTYRGQLCLNINYTAGVYDDNMIEDWMDKTITTLRSGLQIQV